MIVHVEMAPRLTFCMLLPNQIAPDDQTIKGDDWIAALENVQHATCEQCLFRIFMLGDSAKIKLARMGRTVEVHDQAPEQDGAPESLPS